MAERGVGAVVVLEGDAIAAILTERDVMKAVAAGKDGSAPVAEWMTRHPDTIEPGDTTDHAASLMIHGGFRHLPVVEDGKVVGIVSIRDLMKVALDSTARRGGASPPALDVTRFVVTALFVTAALPFRCRRRLRAGTEAPFDRCRRRCACSSSAGTGTRAARITLRPTAHGSRTGDSTALRRTGQLVVNRSVAVKPLVRRLSAVSTDCAGRSGTCELSVTCTDRRVGRVRRIYDITASFECRQSVPSPCTGGSRSGHWSNHAYGHAIDLNPRENPYVGCGMTRDPTGRAYLDRSRLRRGMVTPEVVRAFALGRLGLGRVLVGQRPRTTCTSPRTATERAARRCAGMPTGSVPGWLLRSPRARAACSRCRPSSSPRPTGRARAAGTSCGLP